MIVEKGTAEVPVIYSAHHASHNFHDFDHRIALDNEQKVRFSDYGTDQSIPANGLVSIIAEHSRALGDLNRDPNDPGRFQDQDYHQPDRHNIWKLGQELSSQDKAYCDKVFYQPYHQEIVSQLKKRSEPTFVVSWDNTAHYYIGDDSLGRAQTMRPFILSNRGDEGNTSSSSAEITSCDPLFLGILADRFSNCLSENDLPSEVLLNFVFKGGYICRQYSSLRNDKVLKNLGITCDVQSLQLEYDAAMTHDQITLEPKPEAIKSIKNAFEKAISLAIEQYSQ